MSELRPEDLTQEERAIWDEEARKVCDTLSDGETAPSWADCYDMSKTEATERILARRALFAPAKEEGKVKCYRCDRCHEPLCDQESHRNEFGNYSCKIPQPAQPSPVAPPSEMPEAVHDAWILLDVFGQQDDDDGRAHRRAAVALREWWRSQPAPAAVRMTPELERLLQFAQAKADGTLSRVIHNDALADIAAVRAQAEQAQWVRLPKVRGFFNVVEGHAAYLGFARERKEALAEIDAAEGKVTE